MGEDPHLRARDEDRDATVEEIEAAYVDGQITDADRDLRVGNALRASTLGELQMIVRDLQRPGAAPARPTLRPRGLVIPLVVMVVATVATLAVVFAIRTIGAGGTTETASDPGLTQATQTPTGQDTGVDEDTYTMTPAGVRSFITAYEQQFGTFDVLDAVLYVDDRILLEVPVRGNSDRYERWTYKGEFTMDDGPTANVFHLRPFDLRTLHVKRLFENIEKAKRILDVEAAALTHVNLTSGVFDDGPVANIYVGNEFRESGYLRTRLTGEVVRAYPFQS